MAEPLPDPLTPADCDLRGMPYMPLYGDRLFGSATWIAASADAKVAALRLWWRSFAHEVPAASLPDDDVLLADYAGYGIAIKAWRRVRPQAMRGWELCSDGRLYHPVVAEVAREAWAQRLRNREKQEKWRNKNRRVTPDVTVTGGVMEPFRNAGSEAKLSEVKGKVTAAAESTTDPARAREAFDAWNAKAAELGIRQAELLTTNRLWRLETVLTHAGTDGWQQGLDRIVGALFLRDNTGGWQGWFDLDWLLEGDHFVRLCEGKYDRPRGPAEQPPQHESYDQRRRREAREAIQ